MTPLFSVGVQSDVERFRDRQRSFFLAAVSPDWQASHGDGAAASSAASTGVPPTGVEFHSALVVFS